MPVCKPPVYMCKLLVYMCKPQWQMLWQMLCQFNHIYMCNPPLYDSNDLECKDSLCLCVNPVYMCKLLVYTCKLSLHCQFGNMLWMYCQLCVNWLTFTHVNQPCMSFTHVNWWFTCVNLRWQTAPCRCPDVLELYQVYTCKCALYD